MKQAYFLNRLFFTVFDLKDGELLKGAPPL